MKPKNQLKVLDRIFKDISDRKLSDEVYDKIKQILGSATCDNISCHKKRPIPERESYNLLNFISMQKNTLTFTIYDNWCCSNFRLNAEKKYEEIINEHFPEQTN